MAKRTRTQAGMLYFVTLTTEGWVDVFSRRVYKDILVQNLRFCQREKDLRIFAYCIMSNHIHLLAACDSRPLGQVLGQYKSFTAKAIIQEIRANPRESRKKWMLDVFRSFSIERDRHGRYAIWQESNFPVLLEQPDAIDTKINYIHDNPVRAGIVGRQEDYLYSSACSDSPLPILQL